MGVEPGSFTGVRAVLAASVASVQAYRFYTPRPDLHDSLAHALVVNMKAV